MRASPPPPPPPLKLSWLRGTLAGVDRTVTPWLVVGMHRPMYVDTVDTSDQDVATSITDAIEKLLVQYEVCGWVGVWVCGCVY